MIKDYFLISDAAHMVEVEAHVLRYWEDELKLPIKRNELGHRYYTNADIERFRRIKELKEQGLQLKAIRLVLKDGKLSVGMIKTESKPEERKKEAAELDIAAPTLSENKEEKARRLQWLLGQMIAEAVKSNNQELCKELKESVVKELDYQFRMLDEKDDMREQERIQREEGHFQKIDELLRIKSRKRKKL